MIQTEAKFIVKMAFLMSLAALSIDTMLPALGHMQESLNIADKNDSQLIISMVFFGMSFGLMFYGPLSDAYGRKKPLYFGLALFLIGSVISLLSKNLEIMLLGRFIQGFGAAAARVITTAIIRDCYSGAGMAKIMSLIMMIFVLVPAIAPTLGQIILHLASWQVIFVLFIVIGLINTATLLFGLEETLAPEKRIPFSFANLMNGIKETIKNPISRAYMIASGLIFGAFVAYLSLSQQILQVQYGLGDHFSYYFGTLALFIGFSSYLNSKIVEKLGMSRLTNIALIAIAILSGALLLLLSLVGGEVSVYVFLGYLGIMFLFVGLLFGNLNSLAIEPLGHIAGVANSVISSVQTFISVGIGVFVGQTYSGNIYPLIIAFLVLSISSFLVIKISTRGLLPEENAA